MMLVVVKLPIALSEISGISIATDTLWISVTTEVDEMIQRIKDTM